jgi:hypothetical protein
MPQWAEPAERTKYAHGNRNRPLAPRYPRPRCSLSAYSSADRQKVRGKIWRVLACADAGTAMPYPHPPGRQGLKTPRLSNTSPECYCQRVQTSDSEVFSRSKRHRVPPVPLSPVHRHPRRNAKAGRQVHGNSRNGRFSEGVVQEATGPGSLALPPEARQRDPDHDSPRLANACQPAASQVSVIALHSSARVGS